MTTNEIDEMMEKQGFKKTPAGWIKTTMKKIPKRPKARLAKNLDEMYYTFKGEKILRRHFWVTDKG